MKKNQDFSSILIDQAHLPSKCGIHRTIVATDIYTEEDLFASASTTDRAVDCGGHKVRKRWVNRCEGEVVPTLRLVRVDNDIVATVEITCIQSSRVNHCCTVGRIHLANQRIVAAIEQLQVHIFTIVGLQLNRHAMHARE